MMFWVILITALATAIVTSIILKPKEQESPTTIYEIDNKIQSLSGKKTVLKNIKTECEGHFGTIDTLLIHEQGIFLIYYTRTSGRKIDNKDKNKWIVSTENGLEYIPNYITQSDYDIIFLTKILNLYKHNFKVIIALGEKEYFSQPVKQIKSIQVTNKKYLLNILKRMIDENIVIYKDDKINNMQQAVTKASEQVQQKIYDMGKIYNKT
uniref:NERD domain-containing protein n=1 Tax=Dulem virus 51 TaxID=3145762 RepID=A0AAU8AV08_9VIRU